MVLAKPRSARLEAPGRRPRGPLVRSSLQALQLSVLRLALQQPLKALTVVQQLSVHSSIYEFINREQF